MVELGRSKRALITFPGQEKKSDPVSGSSERSLLEKILNPYYNLVHQLSGLKDSIFFGNSFGIYAALIASGALNPEDGASLVDHRGQIVRRTEGKAAFQAELASARGEDTTLMGRTGMLRLIGIDPGKIDSKYKLSISNDYGFIKVVTGYQNALDKAVQDLGYPKGATVLEVDGAYHDIKRQSDSEEFAKLVDKTPIESPKNGQVVSSTNARILSHPDDIKEELVGMMVRPVIFKDILKVLKDNGAAFALDLDAISSFKKITGRIEDAKEWLTSFTQGEQDAFFGHFSGGSTS